MKFTELKNSVKKPILELIKKHKWKIFLKEYPFMMRVTKEFKYSLVKMNIYWDGRGRITKVSTHLDHPKKGKGQMFRIISNYDDLEKLLINPRKHTKNGYGRTLKNKK